MRVLATLAITASSGAVSPTQIYCIFVFSIVNGFAQFDVSNSGFVVVSRSQHASRKFDWSGTTVPGVGFVIRLTITTVLLLWFATRG